MSTKVAIGGTDGNVVCWNSCTRPPVMEAVLRDAFGNNNPVFTPVVEMRNEKYKSTLGILKKN